MSKNPSVFFSLFKRNKKLATKKVELLQKHPNLKYIKYPLLPNNVRLNFFRFQDASCRIQSKERNCPERAPKHKFSPKTLDTLQKLMCARLMGHYPPEMEYSVMVLIFVVQKIHSSFINVYTVERYDAKSVCLWIHAREKSCLRKLSVQLLCFCYLFDNGTSVILDVFHSSSYALQFYHSVKTDNFCNSVFIHTLIFLKF